MIIDLFIKLVDHLILLAKTRQEIGRDFYLNFVAPAFRDFENIHSNYLASIQKYRDMVMDTSIELGNSHPIFEIIAQDNLYSANLRAKIYELYSTPVYSGDGSIIKYPSSNPSVFDPFVHSIHNYMEMAYSSYEAMSCDTSHNDSDLIMNTKESIELLKELQPEIKDYRGSYMGDIQLIRILISIGLRRIIQMDIKDDLRRAYSKTFIDLITAIIQSNYRSVVHEHNLLKSKLLVPK